MDRIACPRCVRSTDVPVASASVRCRGCGATVPVALGRRYLATLRLDEALLRHDALDPEFVARLRALVAEQQRLLRAAAEELVPPLPLVPLGAGELPLPEREVERAGPPARAPAPTLWSRLAPLVAERLLFVLAGFLLLAGAVYFVTTAWTTMTGATRLFTVVAALAAFGGMLWACGRALARAEGLAPVARVLTWVAIAATSVAAVAAGELLRLMPWAGAGAALAVAAQLALLHAAQVRDAGGGTRRDLALLLTGLALLPVGAPWLVPWLPQAAVVAAGLLLGLAALLRRPGTPLGGALPWLLLGHGLLAGVLLCAALGLQPDAPRALWAPGLLLAAAAAAAAWLEPAVAAARPRWRSLPFWVVVFTLGVAGLTLAVGRPDILLGAALLTTLTTLRAAFRLRSATVLVPALVLSALTYLLLPAPVREAALAARRLFAGQLGYTAERLPLSFYGITCLPYLGLVVWFTAWLHRKGAVAFARVADAWLLVVTATLAGVALLLGTDLRAPAAVLSADGALLIAAGVWLARSHWVGAGTVAVAAGLAALALRLHPDGASVALLVAAPAGAALLVRRALPRLRGGVGLDVGLQLVALALVAWSVLRQLVGHAPWGGGAWPVVEAPGALLVALLVVGTSRGVAVEPACALAALPLVQAAGLVGALLGVPDGSWFVLHGAASALLLWGRPRVAGAPARARLERAAPGAWLGIVVVQLLAWPRALAESGAQLPDGAAVWARVAAGLCLSGLVATLAAWRWQRPSAAFAGALQVVLAAGAAGVAALGLGRWELDVLVLALGAGTVASLGRLASRAGARRLWTRPLAAAAAWTVVPAAAFLPWMLLWGPLDWSMAPSWRGLLAASLGIHAALAVVWWRGSGARTRGAVRTTAALLLWQPCVAGVHVLAPGLEVEWAWLLAAVVCLGWRTPQAAAAHAWVALFRIGYLPLLALRLLPAGHAAALGVAIIAMGRAVAPELPIGGASLMAVAALFTAVAGAAGLLAHELLCFWPPVLALGITAVLCATRWPGARMHRGVALGVTGPLLVWGLLAVTATAVLVVVAPPGGAARLPWDPQILAVSVLLAASALWAVPMAPLGRGPALVRGAWLVACFAAVVVLGPVAAWFDPGNPAHGRCAVEGALLALGLGQLAARGGVEGVARVQYRGAAALATVYALWSLSGVAWAGASVVALAVLAVDAAWTPAAARGVPGLARHAVFAVAAAWSAWSWSVPALRAVPTVLLALAACAAVLGTTWLPWLARRWPGGTDVAALVRMAALATLAAAALAATGGEYAPPALVCAGLACGALLVHGALAAALGARPVRAWHQCAATLFLAWLLACVHTPWLAPVAGSAGALTMGFAVAWFLWAARGDAVRRQHGLVLALAWLGLGLLWSWDQDTLAHSAQLLVAALCLLCGGAALRASWLGRAALLVADLALLQLWLEQQRVDPAFYGVPTGLCLVLGAEWGARQEAHPAPWRAPFRIAGLMLAYGSVAVQVVRVEAPIHALVLLGLGLLSAVGGVLARRTVYAVAGAVAVVLDVVAYLVRHGLERDFLGAVLLVAAGATVLAVGAVLARRRRASAGTTAG